MTAPDHRNGARQEEAAAPGGVRRWRAFSLLAGAFFMTIVDLTITNVALPTIGVASGLLNTSQQIGGAIGVAVASTVAATHSRLLLSQGHAAATALTGGFQWAFWVTGLTALAAGPVTFLLIRRTELARAGVPIVINARADTFLPASGVPAGERVAEAVRRGRLYLAAGADCIYPIGVSDENDIAALVAGVPGPINANTRPGGPGLAKLRDLGVARVSYGPRLYRDALAGLKAAVQDLLA